MVLVQKTIKNIYLGDRGEAGYEFSYNCSNGSLASFQEAGGSNIDVNGSYGFDSNGIYLTSSGYDHWFALFGELPDLSVASKITIKETAYYVSGSWSNNKRCGITATNSWSSNPNHFNIEMAYNSSSPGTYNGAGVGLTINNSQTWIPQRYYEGWGTGDIEATLEIDLTQGNIVCTVTGANTKNYSGTLTSEQLATIKTWKYWFFQKEEGYQYRGERLKTLYVKVE